MSRVYDEQFKQRIGMHMLVCDPGSANIIFELRAHLEQTLAKYERLREAARAVEKSGLIGRVIDKLRAALDDLEAK